MTPVMRGWSVDLSVTVLEHGFLVNEVTRLLGVEIVVLSQSMNTGGHRHTVRIDRRDERTVAQ